MNRDKLRGIRGLYGGPSRSRTGDQRIKSRFRPSTLGEACRITSIYVKGMAEFSRPVACPLGLLSCQWGVHRVKPSPVSPAGCKRSSAPGGAGWSPGLLLRSPRPVRAHRGFETPCAWWELSPRAGRGLASTPAIKDAILGIHVRRSGAGAGPIPSPLRGGAAENPRRRGIPAAGIHGPGMATAWRVAPLAWEAVRIRSRPAIPPTNRHGAGPDIDGAIPSRVSGLLGRRTRRRDRRGILN